MLLHITIHERIHNPNPSWILKSTSLKTLIIDIDISSCKLLNKLRSLRRPSPVFVPCHVLMVMVMSAMGDLESQVLEARGRSRAILTLTTLISNNAFVVKMRSSRKCIPHVGFCWKHETPLLFQACLLDEHDH
jgi:hypothetical protein